MADLIVDASVVAKWYIPETHHEQARALRDDYLDGTHDLFAPALLPFEVVNALRYSGHYDGQRLATASETLSEYGIELVRYGDCGPVATVATDLDITVYDAAYVALSRTLDATVYTADSQLVAAVEQCDDEIVHVQEY